MFRFLLIMMFVFPAWPSYAINYFRCDQTSDCIKAYGGCGRYLSVHRRYKELYEAKAHNSDKVASCLPPTEKDKIRKHQGQVVCHQQSCRLLMPNNSDQAASSTTQSSEEQPVAPISKETQ
jgi:hypothetical protein